MEKTNLFVVHENVVCLNCQHTGAVEFYGALLESGKLSGAVGFGGTIPCRCTNCGNSGLIDCGGFECYKMAFTTKKGEI